MCSLAKTVAHDHYYLAGLDTTCPTFPEKKNLHDKGVLHQDTEPTVIAGTP
jgi:hypothetical protein